MVQADIKKMVFQHSDIALYTLHLSAVRSHKKMVFKKNDLKDVRERIKIMFPIGEAIPKEGDLFGIDQSGLDLIEGVSEKGFWRVEWMYEGRHHSRVGPGFNQRFKPQLRGVRDLYVKMTDTLQFEKKEMAHKLWLESLYRPGQTVMYEGWAYALEKEQVVYQTARVLSFVLDYEHIITVTTVI